MREIQRKSWSPRTNSAPEQVLELYYDKLQKWGAILTRGDKGMAQEIVHDLCLYFTVVKPDLSRVENLDGYLYTSLRHIYLSALTRSSREAVQLVNITDFDSIQFALNPRTTDDLLERQNALRRICNYAVWRKKSSKSASYFILHFFHGYARREIAEIACLPIAAIYNKLKVARDEVKSHLEASRKLRIAIREAPPEPELLLSPISSAALFDDLQETIFEARDSECPPEEALLKQYQTADSKPIPCGLLSHIVSCKHCLAVIDHHFHRPTWENREPPNSVWSSTDQKNAHSIVQDIKSYKALMRAIQWQSDHVYDHRPRTLSIAVNGKITAFHDVQSERSTLAARIENVETAQFIEVFTDQHIRLAMLPIDELPPGGAHAHTQRVKLSDDRWLELVLSFDGLGLHSEVTYFDPTLAAQLVEEGVDVELPDAEARREIVLHSALGIEAKAVSVFAKITRNFRGMSPRFVLAWTTILAVVLSSTGYLAYRYYNRTPENANEILNRSIQIETAGMKGETEHEILRLDTTAADGHALWQGTVDVWKENDTGRTMRRLYNAQHRLLAAEWRRKNGESGSYMAPAGGAASQTDREVAESTFWKCDVSARAFHALAGSHMRIRTRGGDYELTSTGLSSTNPHLVSATLVLNQHLHAVSETLRVSGGYAFTEVRFVETHNEHFPSASVPDSDFDPSDLKSSPHKSTGSAIEQSRMGGQLDGTDPGLVRTEIAVLYRLNELGEDVGEPIQITRTPGGQIRIAGTLPNEALKRRIIAALGNMPDHQLLEIHLATERSLRIPTPSSHLAESQTSVYDVARTTPLAEPLIRRYFAAKGFTGEQFNSAVAQFSRDVLDHAQRALQNAYALDRLGTSFTPEELRVVGPVSQWQWSVMVAKHSSALKIELEKLQQQIVQLRSAGSSLPSAHQSMQIDTPADFVGKARTLLADTQKLNREVGSAFSSGLAGTEARSAESSIDAVLQSIPLNGAEQLAKFGSRLVNAKDASNRSGEQYPQLPR